MKSIDVEGLKRDGIVIKTPNKEVMEYIRKYHKRNLVCKIIANRYSSTDLIDQYINIRLDQILNREYLKGLPDIVKGSKLITDTVLNKKRVLHVSDYDVDGVTSASVGYHFFKNVFKHDNIEVLVNKREYGNGINRQLANIIRSLHSHEPFDLMITSDHGSHDEEVIKELKYDLNISIIVTDHHLFDDITKPISADAFINPRRIDSKVTPLITGTTVLYFTLLYAAYDYFKTIDLETMNYIYYLLTYVGMTVVSDCVSLQDPVNKKLLIKAFHNLNSVTVKQDVFWSVVKKQLAKEIRIDETVLGYEIIPMLNTPGRIDNPRLSFELMTSETTETAIELYGYIKELNNDRKAMQSKLAASDDKLVYKDSKVMVGSMKGADGIQGILANNIMYSDNYKVVIFFTEQVIDGEVFYVGSGRCSDETLSLKEVLDSVNEKSDIIITYGGHDKAVGVKIKPQLKHFFKLVKKELDSRSVKAIKHIEVDEVIYSNKKLITSIADIKDAGPYGIDYESPKFVSDVMIDSYRVFRKPGKVMFTARVYLSDISDFKVNLFYTIKKNELELIDKIRFTKYIRVVYTISINTYMNDKNILLNVEKLILLEDKMNK